MPTSKKIKVYDKGEKLNETDQKTVLKDKLRILTDKKYREPLITGKTKLRIDNSLKLIKERSRK